MLYSAQSYDAAQHGNGLSLSVHDLFEVQSRALRGVCDDIDQKPDRIARVQT